MILDFIKELKKYKSIFKENKKYILVLVLLSMLTVLFSILTPSLVAKILSTMVNKKYSFIIIILLLLGVIQGLNLLANVLSSKVFLELRQKLILGLKKQISASILNLDMEVFSENRKGKFIQRINSDPTIIADCLFNMKRYFILLCTNIGVIGYSIYLSPILGLIYLIASFTILTIRAQGVKRKKKIQNYCYEEKEKNASLLNEIFNGIKDVKANNIKGQFENKAFKEFDNIERLQYKADFYFDLCVKITIVIEWIANSIIVLLSAYLLSKEIIILDTFLVIFMYRKNIFSFSDSFTEMLNGMSIFNLSSERIFEIIDLANIDTNETEEINDKCEGNIEFKNISFSYNDRTKVLNECDIKFNTNEATAIIGKSGVGKTTVLNLIAKMYKPDKGELLIDNVDISNLSESYIRKNISMISQNYYLFDMSIKENLALVKPELTDEEMVDVCRKVGLEEFILTLPEKYNTNIGEGGYFLSGGQRQRLAIARALLLNTKIMLFDEVTSSLDMESKQAIKDLIKVLKKEHTIIVVTHEEFLLENCDKVYSLQKGKMKSIK